MNQWKGTSNEEVVNNLSDEKIDFTGRDVLCKELEKDWNLEEALCGEPFLCDELQKAARFDDAIGGLQYFPQGVGRCSPDCRRSDVDVSRKGTSLQVGALNIYRRKGERKYCCK